MASCKPDEYQLGELYSKNDLKYRIYQNPADSNMIILESQTPNVTPYWIHPQGYSTRVKDTLRIPFPGVYVFVYGVLSPGGLVQADTFYLTINTTNLMYVSDTLWTYLTGGPGNEKVWLLDIDENGVSKYFNGPCYWMGGDNGWHYECMVENGICWYWEASYAGNEWMGDKGDHGIMIFSLKGGAYVTVNHKLYQELGIQNGTFDFNVKKKTIKFTNAIPLIIKNSWCLNDLDFSSEMKIVSLTENTLQIGVKNKTKNEYMIFNYISKEYSDNWVPPVQEDPNFTFEDINQKDALTVTNSRTWKFDLNVPYNWTDLNGNFLNNWNSRQDIINTGWAPYNDEDTVNIDDIRITFYANGTVRIKKDNGTIEIGTFTLNEEKNLITFVDVKPEFWIAGWVTATTTASNQWKIVKIEKDDKNYVKGIWFGKRAEDKKEYMVFHFIATD